MPKLTPDQIYAVCVQAGFTPDQAVTWTAIALAESGGDTTAHNPHGEDSWGLFQVNVDPHVRANHWGNLSDPLVNARAAYEISSNGTNMRPWTVTHAGNAGTAHDYRNFIDEARGAAGGAYTGDFSGVTGYHDPSGTGADDPGAVPPGGAPLPDAAPLPAGVDTDHDGALDDYEMSVGTDPDRPDSDGDGLTDGFEILHHLDPLQVDTDHDGLSDRHEITIGTNPLDADTDHDGMSDAMELAAGRDPVHGLAVPADDAAPLSAADSDHDGLSDAWEASIGTNPHDADTDHDGISDAMEQAAHTDPLHPDTDHDGSLDGVDHVIDVHMADIDQHDPLGAAGLPPVDHAGEPPPLLAGAPAAPPPVDAHPAKVQQFLDAALAQTGDHYVFGAEAHADNADPDTFDCSELTQWAASRVGVQLPDGSWLQYLQLKEQGHVIPVEQALHTPGALLFDFPSEPTAGGGRLPGSHVAISLGDGRTIEARNPRAGVGTWEAGDRFTYAAVLPELGDPAAAVPLAEAPPLDPGLDSDHDGLTDAYEMSIGTDPHNGDSDGDGLTDGFEVALGHADIGPDADHDGLTDAWEQQHGTNPTLVDTDGDGLSDAWEVRLGTNPLDIDSDHDGISDALEAAAGRDARYGVALHDPALGHDPAAVHDPAHDPTAMHDPIHQATVIDADGDGLSDAWESSLGSDPNSIDSDHDGLSDALELVHHTDPHNPDTDHDGILDGHEHDQDHHHLPDGH
jgi:cell wall-associated NlpC family hydrolase